MASNRSTGLFWLLVLGGYGVYWYSHTEAPNGATIGKAASGARIVQAAAPDLPYAERQFVDAVHQGHAAYDAGGNDMQKGATRPRRAKAVCAAIPSGNAVDWVGTIYKLSSNGDGKGVLEIQIAPDVWIKTWNNSLSDIGSHTLIEPDSQLFQAVSVMSSGQAVRFSGAFVRDGTDCFRESSMSISGSMTEPEYIMRFTSAAAA